MFTLRTNFGLHANNVAPDQTAPIGAVRSGYTLFATVTFQNDQ